MLYFPLISCSYNSLPCGDDDITQIITDFGVCYTFNKANDKVISFRGQFLYLDISRGHLNAYDMHTPWQRNIKIIIIIITLIIIITVTVVIVKVIVILIKKYRFNIYIPPNPASHSRYFTWQIYRKINYPLSKSRFKQMFLKTFFLITNRFIISDRSWQNIPQS